MKKRSKNIKNIDRIVYEIRTQSNVTYIDVATTAELKTRLSELLPLDAYSVQAASQLVHHANATVEGQNWSIKRIGKLTFVPDQIAAQKHASGGATETPSVAPNASSDWPKLL